jgi:hypothetical protein
MCGTKKHTLLIFLYSDDRYQSNVKLYTVRHKQSEYDCKETELCKPQIHCSEKCAVRWNTVNAKHQAPMKVEINVKKK